MNRLSSEAISEKISLLDGWNLLDSRWIVKKYRFSTFQDAIRFVNLVAKDAEEKMHHPFISIEYKVVTLQLTSWNAGGLTSLDFTCASTYDELFRNLKK